MIRLARIAALLLLAATGMASAKDSADSGADPRMEEFRNKIRALNWLVGPRDVALSGNATLSLPEGYVYLDAANTAKFEELNQNLSSGKEVMIAPKTLGWTAYLIFESEGYVKDNEKIDADAILKTLQQGTEEANQERRRRGWEELHLGGWNLPPAYNTTTKRLEWATLLRARNGEATNFVTKILGRKGYTTVVLVTSPDNTTAAVADVDTVLRGYRFNGGDTYADWRPGDKVAEYGLTGLIVGGAVAAAVKTGLLKGLWKFLVAGIAAFWKLLLAGAAAIAAALRSLFKRRQAQP
ncbi:MAG TPA: DUF2167 domain-containing protein [Steroidobacteraceae bacterium]|nr:DUF2167 domain-containing protein [Steroidobacteraceae bacterium]